MNIDHNTYRYKKNFLKPVLSRVTPKSQVFVFTTAFFELKHIGNPASLIVISTGGGVLYFIPNRIIWPIGLNIDTVTRNSFIQTSSLLFDEKSRVIPINSQLPKSRNPGALQARQGLGNCCAMFFKNLETNEGNAQVQGMDKGEESKGFTTLKKRPDLVKRRVS